jgi:probable HAF family extracellular repeat protein
LCRANGINNRGQIVGQGVIDGRNCAFLLTPNG